MKHNVMDAFDDVDGDKEVKRVLVATFGRQSEDEQSIGESVLLNGIGFRQGDERIGESLALKIINDEYLSPAQMKVVRILGKRYAKQDKDVKAGKRGV